MADQIKLRRDTAANWSSVNPVLVQGEPGFETDTRKLKIGNGSTAWNSLDYTVSSGLTDGDKGDITVSASGATWTVDNGAITLAKQADVATASVFYRKTAGTGAPEVQSLATLKTDLDLSGTNTGDQDLSGKASTGAIGSTGITMSTARLLGRSTASTGAVEEIALGTGLSFTGTTLNAATPGDWFILACSDETTALTTGTNKLRFRMPYAGTLTAIRASVNTAPTGAALVVDVNEDGTTVLSTKLSIDATELTSTTAAVPAVISDSALADDAEISIDIDQVGSTVAGAGLKVSLFIVRA